VPKRTIHPSRRLVSAKKTEVAAEEMANSREAELADVSRSLPVDETTLSAWTTGPATATERPSFCCTVLVDNRLV